jgi:hypothetical protein
LSAGDRAKAILDATDDEVVSDPYVPNILGSDAPKPRTLQSKSRITTRNADDVYDRDRILHEVEYTDSASFVCIGDDRGLSDEALATAQRTTASVTLRASIIDQQCKLVAEHNAATIAAQFQEKK